MDVDGNGRDDIIIEGSNGELHAILNFGKPSNGSNLVWHEVDQFFSGTGSSNYSFADLNNDGRDDVIVMNADGSFYSFLNIRGVEQGQPVWVRQDTIKPPQSWPPPNLRMSDVTGDGQADYIMVAPQSASMAVFANNGTTDASVAGDGIWFADMDGDGLDDKIWISLDGHISVWLNGQANAQASHGWVWFAQNERQPISTGINARREQYRLADVDGDGKADMLIVDLNTGAISAWLNNGANMTAGAQGWNWTPVGQIRSSSDNAAGIRFADVTGDGKADLISLDQASGMTIYRNDYDPSWHHWSWMKITNGPINLDAYSPKDVRFADMDGDQKADAIWVHPWDGSIVVWLNKDASKQEGWVRSVATNAATVGPAHLPCAGENVMFARISIPWGRADRVQVAPHDGSLSVWKNGCDNYAPGSSSMTDNASSSNTSPPELNRRPLASVSCGNLIVPAKGDGARPNQTTISSSTTSLGLASLGRRAGPTTVTVAPVSQIADGQIQAPTSQSSIPDLRSKTSDAQVQVIVVLASDTKPVSSGSTAFFPSKSTAVVVKGGGPTLVAGAPPITVSGTTYSLPTVAAVVVINGQTSSIPTTPAASAQSVQGASQSAQSASTTTASKVVPVVPVPVAGSQTSSQASQAGVSTTGQASVVVVVVGQTLHADATTGFVAGGQSIRPGSSARVVSGHTLSLDSSAHLIQDGSTIPLPQSSKTSASPTTSAAAAAIVAVGTSSVRVESSGFVLGSQTVRPGGPQVAVSSHTLSLDKSAKLVVDGSTTRLAQSVSVSLSTSASTATIIQSTTSTAFIAVGKASGRVQSSDFIIGSQTVRPGGSQIVVSSHTLSLDKSGNLFDGTSTTLRLPQGTTSTSSSSRGSSSGSASAAAISSTSTSGPDVYYGGDNFWKKAIPEVSCDGQGGLEDPCTIIFPPKRLSKVTTYPPVSLATHVEVACPVLSVFSKADGTNSTSTSWSSTDVPTTLTIPAMTSESVSWWNLNVPGGAKDTTVTLTPSFDVQTISTTEDAAICGYTGVPRTFVVAGAAVAGAAVGGGAAAAAVVIYKHRKGDKEEGGGGRGGGGGGGPRGKKCGEGLGPFSIFFKKVFCQRPCILNCPPGWELPHPPDWYSPYKPRVSPLPNPPMPPPLPFPTPIPGPGKNPPNKPKPTNQESQSQGSSSQQSSSKSSSKSSSSSSCSTSTVTDIVKSCGTITSGSTGCRTISTVVSRGCSITAKTITTSSASACPRITIDPNEDQGEDGTPPSKTSCSITAKTSATTSASSCPRITLDPNEDQGEDGDESASATSSSSSKTSSSTSSSSKGTTASATVSSTSSAPPKPTFTPFLPTFDFTVGFFRDHGKIVGTRVAIYYNKQKEDDTYVCRDNDAIWEADTKVGVRVPTDFRIGPFDAQPWTECFYDRPNDAEAAGSLRCIGAGHSGVGTCKKAPAPPDIDCSLSPEHKEITWTTLAFCTMEPPQTVVVAPAPPNYCFSATKLNDDIKLNAGATISTPDKASVEALVKDACEHSKDFSFEKHTDLGPARINPQVRIVLIAKDTNPKGTKFSEDTCQDRFTELQSTCSDYGGSHVVDGVSYTLYAFDRPQILVPKPPIPNAILDKFDHCYDLEHLPSDPDGLEPGGHLIEVGTWKERLEELIDTGCRKSLDPRRFGLPDNDKKDSDGRPLRLYVRARLVDPTDPDEKEPKALLSDANICNKILKGVLND
ncbi:MAG: hypothetical protein Q9207_006306, partial [Kuettlingeria erythrocarpa]